VFDPAMGYNIRYLQLSHADLRIGMEDDVLHFSEGVLVDDVIELALVGIVALREDRKIVIIWSVSKSAPFTLNRPFAI
jgi:hypothetical protein